MILKSFSLFRVTAWTTRFKSKILKKIKNKKENEKENQNNNETVLAEELTREEINEAKKLWVKDNQQGLVTDKNFPNLKYQLALTPTDNGVAVEGWRVRK